MRPGKLYVGGSIYWVIRTYDPDSPGVLKDADSVPTIAIRKNGSAVGDSVTPVKRSATTGIYDCTYNPSGEAEGDQFTVEESATVTGTTTSSATYSQSWGFVVAAVERGSDTAPLDAAGTRSALGLASANLDTQLADLPTVAEFEARTLVAADYFVVTDYTAPLDAAGIRSAIGLASANLDTQIADLPTVAEFEARTLASAEYFVVGDYTAPDNASIDAILIDTGTTLPAALTAIQGATFDTSTDSLEAIRNRGDAAWITGSGGGLTGDYTLTVTVTDSADDEPIEGATVTLFRSGERGADTTDASGEAAFGVDAATWTWIVRAAGYTSQTGTKVITANDTLAVELVAIVVDPPTNPNNATLRVTCIGEDSQIAPGAVVRIRMIEAPADLPGFGFDGSESTFTADANGIAEREVTRGATYEIRREGTYKQWQTYVMPTDEDLIELDSFVQP